MLPERLKWMADTGQRSRAGCQAFQVYSNVAYVLAGGLGVAVGTAPPYALPRHGRVAARVTVTLVGIVVMVTGLVSSWYHRVGTDDACSKTTYCRVGRVDVVCAVTTSALGAAVLAPLTIVGLARRPRAGPAMLLVLAFVVGVAAICLHVNLTRSRTRELRPCTYDIGHGTWHVLGAMSAVLGFCAVFLSLRPGPRPERRLARRPVRWAWPQPWASAAGLAWQSPPQGQTLQSRRPQYS